MNIPELLIKAADRQSKLGPWQRDKELEEELRAAAAEMEQYPVRFDIGGNPVAPAVPEGWPKCCGYTMTIDSPDERSELAKLPIGE